MEVLKPRASVLAGRGFTGVATMSETHEDAVTTLARHVASSDYDVLPKAAVAATKRLILDSLGVGLYGSRGPWVDEIVRATTADCSGGQSQILGRAGRYPSSAAALCNAYQIHNSEFDCVHEAAVVHPMAVLMGAVCAYTSRHAAANRPAISGSSLIAAVALGVDVAGHLGVACRTKLRFFRPATVGAFAAVCALAKLSGFDTRTTRDAMGIVYGQLSGTMQPHTEGAALLAMQIGFSARNALLANDMAAAGIPGLADTFEGPFGYYALFEGEHALAEALAQLGRTWRITEVAHKPFPSGRATHGIAEGCMALRRKNRIVADDIDSVSARVPSLTQRLVGRPISDDMAVNYARLCGAFVAARALLGHALHAEDFDEAARQDPATLTLGRRVRIVADDNPDPNALSPVVIDIKMRDGATYSQSISTVYGHPDNPMSRDNYIDKFERNWGASLVALPQTDCPRAVAALETLETCADVADVFTLFYASRDTQ